MSSSEAIQVSFLNLTPTGSPVICLLAVASSSQTLNPPIRLSRIHLESRKMKNSRQTTCLNMQHRIYWIQSFAERVISIWSAELSQLWKLMIPAIDPISSRKCHSSKWSIKSTWFRITSWISRNMMLSPFQYWVKTRMNKVSLTPISFRDKKFARFPDKLSTKIYWRCRTLGIRTLYQTLIRMNYTSPKKQSKKKFKISKELRVPSSNRRKWENREIVSKI